MKSAARLAEIARGMNAADRKVLDAIPIQEDWSVAQICGELKRIGTPMPHNAVMGHARRLCEAELVREIKTGFFRRIEARISLVSHSDYPAAPVFEESNTVPIREGSTIMDRLTELATDMRKLADRAETLALEAEDELARLKEAAAKYEQIQTLLGNNKK